MGLLLTLVATDQSVTLVDDNRPLLRAVRLMGFANGKLGRSEQVVIDALVKTVPQLQALADTPPERIGRQQFLDSLAAMTNVRLRKQCYVLALEVALASGHVNGAEDQFCEAMQRALRLDDRFAAQVIEVIACKYGRLR
jgi:hypothetical protein